MKINTIKLRNNDCIECDGINLIIGANNSGKTTFIRELSNLIHDCPPEGLNWISSVDISFDKPLNKIFKEIFSNVENFENNTSYLNDLLYHSQTDSLGFMPYRNNIFQNLRSYELPTIIGSSVYKDGNVFNPTIFSGMDMTSPEYAAEKFLSHICVANEFCPERLQQMDSLISIEDVLNRSLDSSPVRQLYEKNDLLKKISKEMEAIFGFNIGFDNIQQGQKRLRIMPQEKRPRMKSQVELAKWWRANSPMISDQGDGVKAYLKIIFSLLDEFNKIIFIDEPETFLHPPQRQSLGKLIAEITSSRRDKQLFISTHDPIFVRSLLNSSKCIKIYHLRTDGDDHLIKKVPIQDITSEMCKHGKSEKAIIYNERILNSFFYQKTILVEDETDRLFYEYYSSLWHANEFQDCNFIGFNGDDRSIETMDRLYNLGIDVRCVVDIDFLFSKRGPEFIGKLNKPLQKKHAKLKNNYLGLSKRKKNNFKNGLQKQGLFYLGDSDKNLYEEVMNGYKVYGLYIVPVGVVESWFEDVSHGNLSQMVKNIQDVNPESLNNFMTEVLK